MTLESFLADDADIGFVDAFVVGPCLAGESIDSAIDWLVERQSNSRWRDIRGNKTSLSRTAITLTMLLLQGETHVGGGYRNEVRMAWKWLLARQAKDGAFDSTCVLNPVDRVVGTLALCAGFAITKDPVPSQTCEACDQEATRRANEDAVGIARS